MPTATELRAKMTALVWAQPTATLAGALYALEAKPKLDEPERLTRATLIDTLCGRHPEADAAFTAWAEDDNTPAWTAAYVVAGAALQASGAETMGDCTICGRPYFEHQRVLPYAGCTAHYECVPENCRT